MQSVARYVRISRCLEIKITKTARTTREIDSAFGICARIDNL